MTRQLVAGALVGFALTVLALALLGDRAPPTPGPEAPQAPHAAADAGPSLQAVPVLIEPRPLVEGQPSLPVAPGNRALLEVFRRKGVPSATAVDGGS